MCSFTNCLAQGARQEQSSKKEATAPTWRASGQRDGGVPEAKGCPLEEGSSLKGVREIFVKSGPRLTQGSFCDNPLQAGQLEQARFAWSRLSLLPVFS